MVETVCFFQVFWPSMIHTQNFMLLPCSGHAAIGETLEPALRLPALELCLCGLAVLLAISRCRMLASRWLSSASRLSNNVCHSWSSASEIVAPLWGQSPLGGRLALPAGGNTVCV